MYLQLRERPQARRLPAYCDICPRVCRLRPECVNPRPTRRTCNLCALETRPPHAFRSDSCTMGATCVLPAQNKRSPPSHASSYKLPSACPALLLLCLSIALLPNAMPLLLSFAYDRKVTGPDPDRPMAPLVSPPHAPRRADDGSARLSSERAVCFKRAVHFGGSAQPPVSLLPNRDMSRARPAAAGMRRI